MCTEPHVCACVVLLSDSQVSLIDMIEELHRKIQRAVLKKNIKNKDNVWYSVGRTQIMNGNETFESKEIHIPMTNKFSKHNPKNINLKE